jgi:hypothetical protein
MSFNRVNPFGWFKSETLTSAQANQLDTNISNGIDKRDGSSDTISSDLTVDTTGKLTFENGSTLTIKDPTGIAISDGNFACGATLIGDTYPLRFGLADVTVNSTSFTVTEDGYRMHCIVLHGALTGATNVILPTKSGYSKIINNQCTGVYNLTVKTAAGTGVMVPNGKAMLLYCDGTNIVEGPAQPKNEIKTILWKAESSANYGDQFKHVTLASYDDLFGYLFIFTDVKAGDKFDINYTAGLTNTSGVGTTYIQVANTETAYALKETIFMNTGTAQNTTTLSTMFTAGVDAATLSFSLVAWVDSVSHDGYVCSPLSLTIKHIRP